MYKEFQTRNLVEFIDTDEPLRVVRRLRSSNRSGKYYFFSPKPFGLNNAPYNPLFDVVSNKFYYIRIYIDLKDNLRRQFIRKVPVFYSESLRDSVYKFIEEMDSPVSLLIGNYAITLRDFIDWNLNRIREVFVFDKSVTVDLYGERKKLAEKFQSQLKWDDWFDLQGHLRARRAEAYIDVIKNMTDALKLDDILINATDILIFNHKVVSEHGHFRVLYYDNNRFLFNFSCENIGLRIYSYDHKSVCITLGPREVIQLSHPFPSSSNIVD